MGSSLQKFIHDRELLRKQVENHNNIELRLLEECQKKKPFRFLVVGPKGSGKSTFIKQIRILYGNGFSSDEKIAVKHGIYLNILEGVEEIHGEVVRSKDVYERPSTIEHANEIRKFTKKFGNTEFITDIDLWEDVINSIQMFIKDKTVGMIMTNKTVYNIEDSTVYFLENFSRVMEQGYLPTEEDILSARVPELGVSQYEAMVGSGFYRFTVLDIGGQPVQRRKFIHIFDNCHAIIFIASLSEYDQALKEDALVNRMEASTQLFSEICNGIYFHSTPILLFLNKIDIFKVKILHTNITEAFPNYEGPQECDSALRYIEDQFWSLDNNEKRMIYEHDTCMTNTRRIDCIINCMRDAVFKIYMDDVGFL